MSESQGSAAVMDEGLRAALLGLSAPLLSDSLGRVSGVVGLQRYHRNRKMVGSALTVKTRPGDNLYVYSALHILRAGEVLVVDAGGGVENAIVGELLQLYASARGCAGFVIDGAIRDIAAFETADFPCYARGVSHRGPFKTGPGRLNVPVSIGGQVISPGDIVVGDEDEIVSFALADAENVVATAQKKARDELAIKAEIASGERDQSWLSPFLLPEEQQRS